MEHELLHVSVPKNAYRQGYYGKESWKFSLILNKRPKTKFTALKDFKFCNHGQEFFLGVRAGADIYVVEDVDALQDFDEEQKVLVKKSCEENGLIPVLIGQCLLAVTINQLLDACV